MFDFWDNNRKYFEMARKNCLKNIHVRQEMFDMIKDNDRVLDVACGTCENGMLISKFAKYTMFLSHIYINFIL